MFARGRGPGIVLMHEYPGITGFAADLGGLLVDYGYTVWMPYLVDPPAGKPDRLDGRGTFVRACITGEFAVLSTGATARVKILAPVVTGRRWGVGEGTATGGWPGWPCWPVRSCRTGR